MKSIFVSFDEIGWYCLREILRMGGEVSGIFTLTDERLAKMSGARPFDDLAAEFSVPLYKIKNINDAGTMEAVKDCAPDISFVVGWSQLVKSEFIKAAAYTTVGMHPTLLPRHRGRAPLPWAIIMGLKKTGVTMFHIDLEADNGEIIGQVEVDIEFEDDAASLYRKTLDAHVDLIRSYWP
ncbi:MAG: formyltransferase family protein, partial [Thermodesulfobacteriota bacterium]